MSEVKHVYEIRPRKDRRGVDLISDGAAIRTPVVWRAKRSQQRDVGYAKFRSRSPDAVIRVYANAGTVIETHEQAANGGISMAAYGWP